MSFFNLHPLVNLVEKDFAASLSFLLCLCVLSILLLKNQIFLNIDINDLKKQINFYIALTILLYFIIFFELFVILYFHYADLLIDDYLLRLFSNLLFLLIITTGLLSIGFVHD